MLQKSSKKEHVSVAEAAREVYQKCLCEAFDGLRPGDFEDDECPAGCGVLNCACAGVMEFVKRTEEAAENSVGSKISGGKFCRSWFDDEVKEAVAARRAAHAEHLSAGTEKAWVKFVQLRRVCSRLVKRKKSEEWKTFLERIEKAYKEDHRQLWQLGQEGGGSVRDREGRNGEV